VLRSRKFRKVEVGNIGKVGVGDFTYDSATLVASACNVFFLLRAQSDIAPNVGQRSQCLGRL